ncbi:hypothetical protein V1477_010770, partial [Vespula maculifrons]
QSHEVHYPRIFNRARDHHACARRHTRECSFYPTRIREEKKKKRKRRRESWNMRAYENDRTQKKRKQRISIRCNETHSRVKTMKLKRKDGHRTSLH